MSEQGEIKPYRVVVLKKYRSRYHSAPACVRDTAKAMALASSTGVVQAELVEGQRISSGLSHDRKSNQWYYVRIRCANDPQKRLVAIVDFFCEKTRPMN